MRNSLNGAASESIIRTPIASISTSASPPQRQAWRLWAAPVLQYTSPGSLYLLGTVIPGIQGNGGQAERDAAMTNALIGMSLGQQTGSGTSADPEKVNGHLTGNLLGSDHAQQGYLRITGYTLLNPLSVPDGGATVMLLGGALGALGMARRFIRR